MKQYIQVIKTMKKNGGYATLGFLNQCVDVSKWKSKTPFASIRRIVQDKRYFFKIRPGLWALNEFKDTVLKKFNLFYEKREEENTFNHTYYQGLVTEIGNLKGYKTFIPNQDKNKLYLEKPLKSVSTIQDIYRFTYDEILNRAKTVDIIWFNGRKFPHAFFEIEHTPNFHNSLGKYHDLQDFYSKFFIVSQKVMKKKFDQIILQNIYERIKNRVKFVDYDFISRWHTKTFEINEIQKKIEI